MTLEDAGIHMTTQWATEVLGHLQSCLCGKRKKGLRMIGEPSPDQAEIPAASDFGSARRALQKVKS